MANTLLTISMITREALRVLENNLTFTKYVRRDFDDSFGKAGAKIGTVLNIRKPARYVGRVGQGLSLEDATETQVPLTLTTQRGVDIAFTSQDLALSVDDFSDRFIRPAVANVANNVDYDGMSQYVNVYNAIGAGTNGAPATVPNTLLYYLTLGQRLDEEAAPRDDQRALIISPAMQATIVDALKGLFQSATDIATQYESGKMGLAIGFKWSMDQNVNVHTVGTFGGTPLVNTAGQTGSTLNTDGWSSGASTLNKGDVFTIDGVYAVNPQSKKSTGSLRQFVVTATTSDSTGAMAALPIYPAITTSGPFQTVSASPADNAAIHVWQTGGTGTGSGASAGTSPQGMAFHKDAFVMGSADLPLPGGVDQAARVADKQLGLSIRLVRAYDINTDRFPTRIDILYGWATLYPELAVRAAS